MPTFMSTLASNPALLQTLAVALQAAAGKLTDANTQLTTHSVKDLDAVWTGDIREAQKKHVDDVGRNALAVVAAMVQAAQTTSAGATQLQAQQAQLAGIVSAALAGQYNVLPTGQVEPGHWHHAQAASSPHGAALMAIYRMIAGMFTTQVNATVAQTTATDAQIAAILAGLAAQFFAQLLQKSAKPSGGTGMSAVPAGSSTGFHATAGTTEGFSVGTALAGASGSGALGGTSLAGASGLSGATAGVGTPAGTMAGVGLAGVGPGQVAGGASAAGAARGRGMAGPGGALVGGGHGTAHAGGGDGDEWRTDLVDDGDTFATDELPGPVVT